MSITASDSRSPQSPSSVGRGPRVHCLWNLQVQLLIALVCGWGLCGSLPRGETAEPLTLDPRVAEVESQRIEAVARAMPSAVSVFVPGGAGGGSGVLISPAGFALTNFHVTSPAGTYMRCSTSDGNVYDAVLVGADPVGDLAMIRLLGRDDFPAAEWGDSLAAEVGDWCMVIGNPFLLAGNLQPTISYGILSGVGRYQYPSGTLLEYGDCLQTDAAVNPGNSGGPLYDAAGRLLGIVGRCSFEKRGRVNVGVGYAISAEQAQNFLGCLRSGRIVDHATLGATVTTDEIGGAVVSNILESSDAFRRGLRYGSEILEIDGRIVATANDVQKVLATMPSHWRIGLRYREQGETRDTLVRLSSVHGPDELLVKMAGAMPPPPPRPPAPGRPPGGEGDEGAPHPHADERATEEIPAFVAEQIVERKGYANYHFNLLEQQRFSDALRSQFPGNQPGDSPAWVITGETVEDSPQPVRLQVVAGQMAVQIGDRPLVAGSKSELYEAVAAQSVAGVLPALDAWRRMIANGPQKFGESYYFGTMPLAGQRPLRDCLVGIDGELEIRWLSHPESQLVEVIEVFADRDSDPAELWLMRDPADADRPQGFELRYGTETRWKVNIESWELVDPSALTPLVKEET